MRIIKPVKRIAVTGGAGQIAYSLIFRIAAGDLFGLDQPIALHLLDLPESEKILQGVVMELEDCAFPLVKEIKAGCVMEEIFDNVHHALLIGAKPRGIGMERKDLLAENGKIFAEQGQVLNRVASKDVQVFVVGNPCNTNCLIAMHNAPDLPKHHFSAMTRLDQNRAVAKLAQKGNAEVEEVTHVVVWGNHSATQVPDFVNARICGRKAVDVIRDRKWLETEFMSSVQKRGAEVIASRGKSSAASAAHAVIESLRSLYFPTPSGDWFSLAVASEKNPYGLSDGLVFSFPIASRGNGDWKIVPGLDMDPFLEEKLSITQKELIEERDLVAHLLRG